LVDPATERVLFVADRVRFPPIATLDVAVKVGPVKTTFDEIVKSAAVVVLPPLKDPVAIKVFEESTP
jgi:hypothetical protein